MMKTYLHLSAAVSLLLIAGCSKLPGGQPSIECTSEGADGVMRSLVAEQIEKAVARMLRGAGDAGAGILNSKIRATVSQLRIEFADVRTSKKDPNSAKRFCTAKLNVSFPSEIITDAEEARSTVGVENIDTLADNNNVERAANRLSVDVDYNVQPTDDGEKVYGQLEDGADKGIDVFAEIVSSHLLKAKVEATKLEADKAAAAQEAEQAAAMAQSQQASLEEAIAENKLSIQTIGAIWQSFPSEAKQRLLPMQRAWIKKKSADCVIQAATVSIDPNEKEVARLKCDTAANQERSNWLQQIRGQFDEADSGAPDYREQ